MLEHLAAATAADQTAVANLKFSNQALSDTLQTRNSELNTANVVNATLQQKIEKVKCNFAVLKAQMILAPVTQTTAAPITTVPSTPPSFYHSPNQRAGHGK